MDERLLRDPSVSLKAKGLWCLIELLKDDPKPSVAKILKLTSDKRSSVNSALLELAEAGYASSELVRNVRPAPKEKAKGRSYSPEGHRIAVAFVDCGLVHRTNSGNLFGNLQNVSAANELAELYGADDVIGKLVEYSKRRNDAYMPQFTYPYQLIEKWHQLCARLKGGSGGGNPVTLDTHALQKIKNFR
jgi:hypothetical protein